MLKEKGKRSSKVGFIFILVGHQSKKKLYYQLGKERPGESYQGLLDFSRR